MKLEGIAGYVPAQRLEWKRYKQYTRNDIMAAIEEVKKGKSISSQNTLNDGIKSLQSLWEDKKRKI